MTDPIDDEFDDEFDDSWADDVEEDSFDGDSSEIVLDEDIEGDTPSVASKASSKKKSSKLINLVAFLALCGGGGYAAFTMGMLDDIVSPKKEKVPVVKIAKEDAPSDKPQLEDVAGQNIEVKEVAINNEPAEVLTPMPDNISSLEVELPALEEDGFPAFSEGGADKLEGDIDFPPGPGGSKLDEDLLSSKTDAEFGLDIDNSVERAIEDSHPTPVAFPSPADGDDIEEHVEEFLEPVQIDDASVSDPVFSDVSVVNEVMKKKEIPSTDLEDAPEVALKDEIRDVMEEEIISETPEVAVDAPVPVEKGVQEYTGALEADVSDVVSVKKKPVYVPVWTIRAVQPKNAVLFDSKKNEMKTVEVGDIVNGLGRITFIGKKNGRWSVVGTISTVAR